jgi:hypothetical protein
MCVRCGHGLCSAADRAAAEDAVLCCDEQPAAVAMATAALTTARILRGRDDQIMGS